MPKTRTNPNPTRGTGGLAPVTPMQVDRVRRSVLDIVRKEIPNVREVLDGTRKWDNQQVRLFGMLLNKVMPDLHHSFNEHTVENKKMHELTIDELEAIAIQATKSQMDDKDPPIPDTDDISDAEIIETLERPASE